MFRLLKSSLLFLILSLSIASNAHAQSIPGISDPVTLKITPSYPRPNATVTVTALSFSTDLNRASLTWTSGGKVIKQGIGAISVTVPSGKPGTENTVNVSVNTPDIGTITQSVSWRPADISLLWRSDGYTPPFFLGKALESYGSTFRVTAIPEFYTSTGKRIDPKTLVYRWKKNNTVDPNASGYGKDSFSTSQASYVRGGDTINVEVSNSDGTIAATKSITLSPGVPEIIFYEDSPLYGTIYEHSMSDRIPLVSEEITLRAEPFDISTNNLFAELDLDWTINGASIPTFKNQNVITLRKTGVVSGESLVGLVIQHQTKILQGGQVNINIIQ